MEVLHGQPRCGEIRDLVKRQRQELGKKHQELQTNTELVVAQALTGAILSNVAGISMSLGQAKMKIRIAPPRGIPSRATQWSLSAHWVVGSPIETHKAVGNLQIC